MEYRFENIKPTPLCGHVTEMSLANNKTFDLWKNFMPLKHKIKNQVNTNLFSVTKYPSNYFSEFNPNTLFKKYAAVNVTEKYNNDSSFINFIIEGGEYVVFNYKGSSAMASKAFEYIFTDWFPKSNCVIDTERLHFEILDERYKKDSEDSEEDIWIPIIEK